MFWLEMFIGVIGAILLEFLYCALTINMKMTNRELETRYMQMQLTWKNLVNANVELVDENKYLKEEIERLNNIINKATEYIDRRDIEWGSEEHNKLLSILKGEDK